MILMNKMIKFYHIIGEHGCRQHYYELLGSRFCILGVFGTKSVLVTGIIGGAYMLFVALCEYVVRYHCRPS